MQAAAVGNEPALEKAGVGAGGGRCKRQPSVMSQRWRRDRDRVGYRLQGVGSVARGKAMVLDKGRSTGFSATTNRATRKREEGFTTVGWSLRGGSTMAQVASYDR